MARRPQRVVWPIHHPCRQPHSTDTPCAPVREWLVHMRCVRCYALRRSGGYCRRHDQIHRGGA